MLKGIGYVQGTENDVLLLDISNNDEYIWTTNFVPQPASPSSVLSSPISSSTLPVTVTVQSNAQPSSNTGVIVGAVIGSVFGSILLTIGSFLFYKRYKNNREQNIAIPTPGNSNYSNRTIGSFLFYKRYYKNNRDQNKAIPTPGSC